MSAIDTLQTLSNRLPYPQTIVLDMRKTVKHWFLNYDYFILRDGHRLKDVNQEHLHVTSLEGERPLLNIVNARVLDSVQSYWSNQIDVGEVKVFAWCNQIVEKDSMLFQLYDKAGKDKGIYCHSLNWTEDIVYVGESIDIFFDLDKAVQEFKNATVFSGDYKLPKKKLSKEKAMSYTDLLDKDEYIIEDAEFGHTPTLEFYQSFIDRTIIPLTNHDLRYSKLELISDAAGILKFNWHVDNDTFLFVLRNTGDGIDGEPFYRTLNLVLERLKTPKRLAAFKHYTFGQEYGLAYLDKNKKAKLAALFQIDVLTDTPGQANV
ncbi:hypothetical protein [Chryseolinea soli]|uniref:Uncharacterized protein n=1 Tax=Chryseolinea soli TaxID=2321403 RepID=A0A385SU11_9BACT|nr:hypothetical protein [Chryseolinea soli]AYB33771.1 hypothetical protein D4L85_25730 [Chryseolinea soli]